MTQMRLEADVWDGEFTSETVANAQLSPELQQRVWSILVDDRILGPKFHKLLVHRTTAAERRERMKKICPNKTALNDWVRRVVSAVAAKNFDTANELAAVLKWSTIQVVNGDATENQGVESPQPLTYSFEVEQFALVEELLKHYVWVDEFGLPLPTIDGSPFHDGMNEVCTLDKREEANQRFLTLSRIYGGSVERWNHQDHDAWRYGDPNDENTLSGTGWVIKRALGTPSIVLSRDDMRVLKPQSGFVSNVEASDP